VTVVQRPLRYPKAWPAEKAQEKGVDVALAVDFVVMAVTRVYDVGILVSTDTDLVPALEGGGGPRRQPRPTGRGGRLDLVAGGAAAAHP
jgi:NYN domain